MANIVLQCTLYIRWGVWSPSQLWLYFWPIILQGGHFTEIATVREDNSNLYTRM